MRQTWYLAKVENDHEITKETDAKFLLEYQHAVLLTLKEQGILTEMQYRYAAEVLQQRLQAAFWKTERKQDGVHF